MRLELSTAIGAYPHTQPLRDGTVSGERAVLRHVSIEPVNRAFRPMVNELTYDVSEMALVTLMLAKAMRRPIRAIPVVLMRQSAHALLGVRADSELDDPRQLEGRRIGVRAYTQTTGTWVRGILHNQFGVDLGRLQWLTFEDAHVDGFVDPRNCVRAADDVTLASALRQGDVDATVGLEPSPAWRPLLRDVGKAEAEWLRMTGVLPLNHTLVVKEELAEQHPWLTRELFELFGHAFASTGAQNETGLAAMRDAIERLSRYACHQDIIPRPYTAEELFEPF